MQARAHIYTHAYVSNGAAVLFSHTDDVHTPPHTQAGSPVSGSSCACCLPWPPISLTWCVPSVIPLARGRKHSTLFLSLHNSRAAVLVQQNVRSSSLPLRERSVCSSQAKQLIVRHTHTFPHRPGSQTTCPGPWDSLPPSPPWRALPQLTSVLTLSVRMLELHAAYLHDSQIRIASLLLYLSIALCSINLPTSM